MSSKSETAAFLRTVPLFKAVAEADLLALASRLHERSLRRGQVLFREGDEGEEMFVVRRGSVIISKPVRDKVEGILARMSAGDFFGEMALFDPAPRSATIQAESDCTLLVMDQESLSRLTEADPHAAAAFFHALVKAFIVRLRESGEKVKEITAWAIEATGLDVEAR